MKKTVCLIGRPNVGKSTIFNRLIRENKSIIMDDPGVTRDRIYGDVTYNEKTFLLIDTGGIDLGIGDFNKDIKAQAEIAVEESDVIVFVVDGREDLTSNDLYILSCCIATLSNLFKATITFLLVFINISRIAKSLLVKSSRPSHTNTITSDSSIAISACNLISLLKSP